MQANDATLLCRYLCSFFFLSQRQSYLHVKIYLNRLAARRLVRLHTRSKGEREKKESIRHGRSLLAYKYSVGRHDW